MRRHWSRADLPEVVLLGCCCHLGVCFDACCHLGVCLDVCCHLGCSWILFP